MTVRRVPGDFRTIQAAVDGSAPGDTIWVAGGIYAESVTIGKGKDRLAIIGAGTGRTILQGSGEGVGFRIHGSGSVTITGFTVKGFTTGIEIFSPNNTIRDVTLTGSGADGALVATEATGNLFFRVNASHNRENGLQFDSGMCYVIDGNFQGNGDDGFDFNGPFSVALGNRASGNDSGVIFDVGGDRAVAIGNRFVGNVEGIVARAAGHLIFANSLTRNTTDGIRFLDAVRPLVLGNELNCNVEEGLQFLGGTEFRVLLNRIEGNGGQGIDLVSGASLGVVDDNEVAESDRAGVRLTEDAAGNVVRRNALKANRPNIEALPPAGAANVFGENRCRTSRQTGLCPCDR